MPPDDLAQDHLTAELRSRQGGSPDLRGRWLGTLVSGATEGIVPPPSIHDLVVVRRTDGRELVRSAAGPAGEDEEALAAVREQLRTRTVADFTADWELDLDAD